MRFMLPRVVILLLALAAGCSGGRPRAELEQLRQVIVVEALGQVGRPYRYGGSTPAGFDCSGLVQYVFAQAGVKLPRSASEQHAAGDEIDLDDAEPGDLLFYEVNGKVDHVAIYLGDGQALHAPASGRRVIVASIGLQYWRDRFVDAVRVIE